MIYSGNREKEFHFYFWIRPSLNMMNQNCFYYSYLFSVLYTVYITFGKKSFNLLTGHYIEINML